MAFKKIPLAVRFWERVNKDGPTVRPELSPCWIWTGMTIRRGYGTIGASRDRKSVHYQAHRVSWEIHNGVIPEGLCVLHRCDNPPCVNPVHLFLGTKKDNAVDMARKRRNYIHPSRLDEPTVQRIRREYAEGGKTHRGLAKENGVSGHAIGCILRRHTWKHIP